VRMALLLEGCFCRLRRVLASCCAAQKFRPKNSLNRRQGECTESIGKATSTYRASAVTPLLDHSSGLSCVGACILELLSAVCSRRDCNGAIQGAATYLLAAIAIAQLCLGLVLV